MFTRNELIRIIFIIALLVTGGVLVSYAQLSPMDKYERDMKLEYERTNIANITEYILNHRDIGKSEFILDGELYKLKVQNSKLSGGYIKKENTRGSDTEWVKGESKKFVVKHRKREYHYTLKGRELQLWSDNLTFFAYYYLDKKEVSIRRHEYNFNHSSYKMFAYDYSFSDDKLIKIQDWFVRDANGIANSMGKQYGKNRSFTDN